MGDDYSVGGGGGGEESAAPKLPTPALLCKHWFQWYCTHTGLHPLS